MSDQVKFGADARDYFSVTKAMQAELDKLSGKVAGFGKANERVGQAGFGGARVAGDIINIATASSGAVSKINALGHILGSAALGAGIVGAAEVAISVFEKIGKVLDDEAKAAKATEGALVKTLNLGSGSTNTSLGALDGRLQSIAESTAAAQTRLTKLTSETEFSPTRFLRDAADNRAAGTLHQVGDKSTFSKSDSEALKIQELILEAGKRRAAIEENIVGKYRQQRAIAEQKASGDEKGAALAEAQLRTQERLADIDEQVANGKLRGPRVKAAKTEVQSQGAAELSAINQKFDEQNTLLESAARIANFKGTAEDRVAFILNEELATAKKLEAAETGAVAKKQRGVQVAQAQLAVENNILQTSLKRISAEASTAQSGIRRKASSLGLTAAPEEAQRIDLHANIDSAKENAGAAKSRVNEEEKASPKRKASAEAVTAYKEALDQVVIAENELLKFDKEQAFSNTEQLKAAKATTRELELQSSGQGTLAEQTATTASYQERIAKALHDGKKDLADQLTTQQQLSLANQRFQRFKETGGHPDQPTPNERQEARERRSFQASERDTADRRAHGSYLSNGTPDNVNGKPNDPNGVQKSLVSSGLTSTGLSPRLPDREFDSQFERGGTFSGTSKFNEFFHPAGGATAGLKHVADEHRDRSIGITKGRNNADLTSKEFQKAREANQPLTKGDMENVMQKYWGGNQ